MILHSSILRIQAVAVFFTWILSLLIPSTISIVISGLLFCITLIAIFQSNWHFTKRDILLLILLALFALQLLPAVMVSTKALRIWYIFLPSCLIVLVNRNALRELILKDNRLQYFFLAGSILLVVRAFPAITLDRLNWESAIGLNVISVSRYSLILLLLLQPNLLDKKSRISVYLLLALLSFLFLSTQTRGLIIPLVISFTMVGIKRIGLIRTVLLAAPILFFLFEFMSHRLSELEHLETVGRVVNVQEGINLFVRNPIFGIGPDMWPKLFSSPYPHNIIIECLVELGLLGSLFILYTYIKFINIYIREIQLSRLEILTFCMLFDSLFSGNISMNILPMLLVVLCMK